jgi:uncharacterized membrane protein YcaP (DUF421 family)
MEILNDLWSAIRLGLGLDAETLTYWQMGLRALVIYVAALALVRIGGGSRLLGQHAAFDVVLGIIFGSILSRAVNGRAPFFETLAAGTVLIGMHVIFAILAFRSHAFGKLVKGQDRVLIRDGQFQRDEMARNWISERDVMAALRANYKIDDPRVIAVARLERSGDISGVEIEPGEARARGEPKIVEVRVEQGVQTVRIELE